jgi:hypothetical protein
MEVAQFGVTELKVSELKSAVEKQRQRENGKDRCKMEVDFEVSLYSILHVLLNKMLPAHERYIVTRLVSRFF